MDGVMAGDQKLTVSVIVCCHTKERLEDIKKAIDSLQHQTLIPNEIILAVDNSRSLYEYLKTKMDHSATVVLNEETTGLSATRNTGVLVAHSDLVAFLDDDAIAEPNWLERMVAGFNDPKVIAVGGRAIPYWPGGRPFWFPEELDWTVGGSPASFPHERAYVRNPHGHNMCFRRRISQGGILFDPSLGRNWQHRRAGRAEEAELCLRLVRNEPDAKVVYEPSARIVHKVSPLKARLGYVLMQSFDEGVFKRMIAKAVATFSPAPLSPEIEHLRYIFSRAVPCRLMRVWSPRDLIQAIVILVCTLTTGVGYFVGGMGRYQIADACPSPSDRGVAKTGRNDRK
jgi:glycosyltransferase involved in cell wall biosynthesis